MAVQKSLVEKFRWRKSLLGASKGYGGQAFSEKSRCLLNERAAARTVRHVAIILFIGFNFVDNRLWSEADGFSFGRPYFLVSISYLLVVALLSLIMDVIVHGSVLFSND